MLDTDKLYLGLVVDNEQGEKMDGSVKVSIDGITDSIETDDLPRYPCFFAPATTPNMGTDIPNVNSRVFVHFPEGNIYNGIVVHSAPSIPTE